MEFVTLCDLATYLASFTKSMSEVKKAILPTQQYFKSVYDKSSSQLGTLSNYEGSYENIDI